MEQIQYVICSKYGVKQNTGPLKREGIMLKEMLC